MLKYIGFDLDDTLYRQVDYEFKLYEVISQLTSKAYGVSETQFLDKLQENFNDRSESFFDYTYRECFGDLPKDWEIFINKIILPVYRFYKPYFSRPPISTEVIDLLKNLNTNYSLILITNGRVSIQKNKIDVLQIRKYFKNIYISDFFDPPLRKPELGMFRLALKDHFLEPCEMLYVGDDDQKDGACEKLGIKFVHSSQILNLPKIIRNLKFK